MTDLRDGTKDLVLATIKRGIAERGAIIAATGLSRQQVDNALTRLQADGDIRRMEAGRRGHGYVAVSQRCLLAETWR